MTSPEDMILTNLFITIPIILFGLFIIMWIVGGSMRSWGKNHNSAVVENSYEDTRTQAEAPEPTQGLR